MLKTFINNSKYENLVFLCGAHDFHAMDWYRKSLVELENINIYILTDLLESENFKCLIKKNDIVFKLLVIDNFLLREQSVFANYWRRFIKILVFPIQIFLIKKFLKKYPKSIFYAHSMYYIWLANFSGIEYVGRPQGSDILIKPFKSLVFKFLSIRAIKKAKAIIVDSLLMHKKIEKIINTNNVYVVPNGIDLTSINKLLKSKKNNQNTRNSIISIRGICEIYRINEILKSRLSSKYSCKIPIEFIYPFYEKNYKKSLERFLISKDKNLASLSKNQMYRKLMHAKLVISIPYSDSSPRSVYEAIFCGAIVAITYNPYYEIFPDSIKERVIIVDIKQKDWFFNAINKADNLIGIPFKPCNKALKIFDQNQTFKHMAKIIFENNV